jgi:murein tripeptide amidase MpaA
VYTQTNNRLWRKNRQPPLPPPANQSCYGRDNNRNWELAWDVNPNGASINPCSEPYKGLAPSDAPENAGLDAFVRQLRDTVGIKLFIDRHSYGQYILSPYGYSTTVFAPELDQWTNAYSLISAAIRNNSDRHTTFTYGPSGTTLYITTGATPDHVYSIGEADFSYAIELPDTGRYGFVLPPEQIQPTVEELWAEQKVLLSILDEDLGQ